ncbi:phytanoyl-CoA dioxygenase family protein [bacterium]|nr:phytanoyl-CoA dioxygenase family protein [bacterium]
MLTQEQVDFYRENGYLLVQGMFSAEEAAHFREDAHALIARLQQLGEVEATWESAKEVTMTKTSLLHCHNVQFHDAGFTRLLVDDRLTSAAAQIIDSPNVQLHHNKLFIKPPEKGSPFPMHQDVPFFPHDNHSMIAAVVHFDDAPLEKGCIRVVPGTHKQGPIPHVREGGWHLPLDQYPLESSLACPAKAGDVLFFSYLTVHGSGVNTSSEARTTLLIQMRDPADPPSQLVHLSRGQGMMLRGFDPTTDTAGKVHAEKPADAMPMGGAMGGAMTMGGGM